MNPRATAASARTVFVRALELPEGDLRNGYLDEACGTDVELRNEVKSLLEVARTPDTLPGPIGPGLSAMSPSTLVGTTIGRYRFLDRLGEGGFGEVYRAEQTEPFHREVALKLIKPGMDSRAVIARFEAERQALAWMDHPNIAQVYDAGTTESGRPYFVMELVRGEPVTTYCDTHRLTVSERLRLFLQVCSGVRHAHRNGVIHRDLKPANVVVVEDRATGERIPKIIDFGIAKSLHGRLTEDSLLSSSHALLGTPNYMSPEQFELGGSFIDTRTDVYALGVLLYELLAGVRPLDSEAFQRAALPEMQRIVREVELPRPSARLKTLGPTQVAVAQRRSTDAATLKRTLSRELDWIVMKAIEKDRDRRYQGAGDLADDLERYLGDQPVEAAPPAAGYRLRKFVRRHRTGVAAAAIVAVALGAGVLGVAFSMQRAAEKRLADRARGASQEMVGAILQDLQPKLEASGQREAAVAYAETVVRYYDELSSDLYDEKTQRAHAAALERWGDASNMQDPIRLLNNRGTYARAAALWREVAALRPGDAEAGAAALRNRFKAEALASEDLSKSEALDLLDALAGEFRVLDRRFPNHPQVRAGLGQVLTAMAWVYLRHGEVDVATDRAIEVDQWYDQLVDLAPEQSWLRVEKMRAQMLLSNMYGRIGVSRLQIRHGEKAIAVGETLLAEDPANVQYLSAMQGIACGLVYKSPPGELDQRVETARAYLQRLMLLKPGETEWSIRDAHMIVWQADGFARDRGFKQARVAYESAVAILDTIPLHARSRRDLCRSISMAGIMALRMGDSEAAQVFFSRLPGEMQRWVEEPRALPDDPPVTRKIKALVLRGKVADGERDWDAMLRVGRTMLTFLEENRAALPEHWQQRSGFEAVAHAFVGKALFMQDRIDDASESLRVAAEGFMGPFRDGSLGTRGTFHNVDRWEAVELYGDSLYHQGNPAAAAGVFEWLHGAVGEHVAAGGRLVSRVAAARCAWKLARTLGGAVVEASIPKEELLAGAVRLLDAPETAARLLPEERELRARIHRALTYQAAL